jgi:hypothetical protein
MLGTFFLDIHLGDCRNYLAGFSRRFKPFERHGVARKRPTWNCSHSHTLLSGHTEMTMEVIMKMVKLGAAILMLAAAMSVTRASAAEVTRNYVSGNYTFTSIMVGDAEVCGNWNITT